MAYSPCFRREAGAAGKDTRGILRVHQFDKVEMVLFEQPEDSAGRPRVDDRARRGAPPAAGPALSGPAHGTGDMGFVQGKKYDLEVWAPGVERWLEVSSCSNFRDFQARRMADPLPARAGREARAASTRSTARAWRCRGSWPRSSRSTSRPDGSVIVPEVLRRYIGADTIGGAARPEQAPDRPAARSREDRGRSRSMDQQQPPIGSTPPDEPTSMTPPPAASPPPPTPQPPAAQPPAAYAPPPSQQPAAYTPPPQQWAPAVAAGPAPGVKYAGNGARLLAYIVDAILLGILIWIVIIVLGILIAAVAAAGSDTAAVLGSIALLVAVLGVSLAYFPWFWSRGGQTPGMKMLRLRVVRAADGGPVSGGRPSCA